MTSGAQRRQHRVTSPTSVAQRACSRGSGRGGASPKARNVASGGSAAANANGSEIWSRYCQRRTSSHQASNRADAAGRRLAAKKAAQ